MSAPSNILEQAEADARAIAERVWLEGYKSGLRNGSAFIHMWAKVVDETTTKKQILINMRETAKRLELELAELEGREQ